MAGAARFPTPVEWQPRLYLLLFAKEFNYLARAAAGNRRSAGVGGEVEMMEPEASHSS